MDFNGHEKIVVSGGRDGEECLYNFIETAIKQIRDWKSENVTWIVANWNYNIADRVAFTRTALEYNVNFKMIDNKQELFDYINKDERKNDPIEEMTFFAHGTAFDMPFVSDPGKGYAVALGYGGYGEHNNALNIFNSDLCKIKSSSFASSSSSVFYSCRTGNEFDNVIFAQEWANVTGSITRAAAKSGFPSYDDGRTNYASILKNPLPFMDTICSIFGKQSPRQKARDKFGFSTKGSTNYPTGNMKVFKPE